MFSCLCICISFIVSDFKVLFLCPFNFHSYFFLYVLIFISLPGFLFGYFSLICRNSLYMMDINPLFQCCKHSPQLSHLI